MKTLILLSGGLDSTVTLAKALETGKKCAALSFNYGQRHVIELQRAEQIAHYYQIPLNIVQLDLSCFAAHSALTSNKDLPTNQTLQQIANAGIPNTYVPARNTLFLAYATGYAEMIQADEIHIGANSLDLVGYPDCRPSFIEAFQKLLEVSTKQAVCGTPIKLCAPLLYLTKAEIMQEGLRLKAPLDMTWSCYNPIQNLPCQVCDACVIRKSAHG